MITANLKKIEDYCKASGLEEDFYKIEIKGVSTDTRNIQAGNLFIPLVGENFDGHDFIEAAREKGALACLCEKGKKSPEDFPTIYVEDTTRALQTLAQSYLKDLGPKVVGISGSNGKTATKDILEGLLSTEYKTHKTQGNFNNEIGLPLTILDMEADTEIVVLEMGIEDFGEMDLLSSIAPPNVGAITNATEAHLDDLGTRDNIAKAKMEFIDNMPADGTYIYCYDDEALRKARKNIKRDIKLMSYGLDENSDYRIYDYSMDKTGCRFSLSSVGEDYFLPLIGSHQILNASAAILIAREFGIKDENIRKGLLETDLTGMRNELKTRDNFTILDDSYKSNPSSLKAALDTLYSLKDYRRKIIVVGDMLGLGDDIEFMHRDIGKIIDENEIDYIIGIGYYSEYIIWEAEPRFPKDRLFHFEEKTPEITELIKSLIIDDTIILVKASRPLELDTIVGELLDK